MNRKTFFTLHFHQVPAAQEEPLTAWCFAAGATGIAEPLAFRQNPVDYSVETVASPLSELTAYFDRHPKPEDLEELRRTWPQIQFEVQEEENRDWLAEWKKGFEPFPLLPQVWLVPPWCQPPREAQKIIWLEPGMAFGTGTHETTKLAAELMATALKTRPGARVLDVGTGTGILALLARHLGAASVLATDVDPEAVRVAGENIERNQQSEIVVSNEDLKSMAGSFDVVVANIIDGVLLLLQRHLKRLVAPGGALILSGIIDERVSHFAQEFEVAPLVMLEERQQNEWRGFLLERKK